MPFLSQSQFEAGERLRADFTRAQFTPRITAIWQANISSGRRSGDAGGIENLTLAALAARKRFDNAMEVVGSELGGIVTDVCCFLKGFEQIEAERRWPKRSAKFMLRAGLSVLTIHYRPKTNPDSKKAHKWGADDYKPVIL